MHKLTDRAVRSAIFNGKGRSNYPDGGGLSLRVNEGGTKTWLFRYRFNGKSVNYTLGQYPTISLAEARALHLEAKILLANNINPADKRKNDKREQMLAEKAMFSRVAVEWLVLKKARVKEITLKKIRRLLNVFLLPEFGDKRIDEIQRHDLVVFAEKLNDLNKSATARDVLQVAGQIFEFAILRGLIKYSPVSHVVKLLNPVEVEHFAALPENEISLFFEELILSPSSRVTKIALLLIMLTASRNGSLRQSEWANIDFEKKTWFMPAETMKKGNDFVIPLSDWAIELLLILQKETGHQKYLFACPVGRLSRNGYLSNSALRNLIVSMGFDGHTDGKSAVALHGFRSLFTDICMKQGYSRELVKKALAHTESDQTFKAYYRADMVEERRELMNFYGELLRKHYHAAQKSVQKRYREMHEDRC